MVRYSDTRRNDPVVRAEVVKLLEAQEAAAAEALALSRKASNLLRQAADGHMDDSTMRLYKDAADAVSTAVYHLDRVARYRGESTNETYVGNIAASLVGETIERRLNR
jgi:RNase adaptor protein for sRNA GlmZ degradation